MLLTASLTMVFRRRGLGNQINSLKHVVDQQLAIPAGTSTDVVLVDVLENPSETTTANANTVGSRVLNLFLNVQVVNLTDATGLINNAYMYVYLNPGGNTQGGSIPAVNEVGTSTLRKMVIHQEMAMLSDANDSIPITLFKGVISIPKKTRRLGVEDKITLRMGTPVGGAEINACVQCIYKEFK